jgi:triphosphoribosyl-dephospho-CoA synthase
MTVPSMSRAERAQLAMMLEVCAYPKPGNVDRCHDYEDTWLEHFLASTIFVRPALERAERGEGTIGELIHQAVLLTSRHGGGNTHFGAYILLFPLIIGDGIDGAAVAVQDTTVEDAILFYQAFGLTQVRMHEADELDVNDPASFDRIRDENLKLHDIMAYSAEGDMVAREWTNDFALTRAAADLIKEAGDGRHAIVEAFLVLLATEIDTFIVKKHGTGVAERTRGEAEEVRTGLRSLEEFDHHCLEQGINPGSIADIIIAGIYVALAEGWQWDS